MGTVNVLKKSAMMMIAFIIALRELMYKVALKLSFSFLPFD